MYGDSGRQPGGVEGSPSQGKSLLSPSYVARRYSCAVVYPAKLVPMKTGCRNPPFPSNSKRESRNPKQYGSPEGRFQSLLGRTAAGFRARCGIKRALSLLRKQESSESAACAVVPTWIAAGWGMMRDSAESTGLGSVCWCM
jgi:hypothetical protein